MTEKKTARKKAKKSTAKKSASKKASDDEVPEAEDAPPATRREMRKP